MNLLNKNQYAIWFSDRCNYHCSYCCNHIPHQAPKSVLETSGSAFIEFFDQVEPGCITVSGGEPVLWKDFPIILEALPQHSWIILTNLSRLPHWISHPNIVLIIPAYHEEFAKEERFTIHLSQLKAMDKRVHVKLIVKPKEEYNQIRLWEKWNNMLVPTSLTPLEYSYTFPKKFLKDVIFKYRTCSLYNSRFFRVNKPINRFCLAGTKTAFQVNKDGNIARCSTVQDYEEGKNIFSPHYYFNEQYKWCSADNCYCEWHHWGQMARANDNHIWTKYIETGSWEIPSISELYQFILDMEWDVAGRNLEDSKESLFKLENHFETPRGEAMSMQLKNNQVDKNQRSKIQTNVPDHPPIELVAYYDEFLSYYPDCEMQTKKWVVDNVQPGWVIFDCGANIGYYTILFSKLVKNLGKIYAFEPTPTVEMLKENLAYHNISNVEIHQLALGKGSGTLVDNIFRIWGKDAERQVYNFTTLDKFVRDNRIEKVDCIKIDVDSFDFEVLQGAKETLETKDPFVIVELNHALNHRNQSNMEALEWMAELGYRKAIVLDHDNFVFKKSLENMFEGNKIIHIYFGGKMTKQQNPTPKIVTVTQSQPIDTFEWAVGTSGCKDLISEVGPKYLTGMKIRRIMDFASGTNEEITQLAPEAEEYYFLDGKFLPPPKPKYHLFKQTADTKIPLPDNYLDVVTTNGSFDHFKQADRLKAFLEIERVLRPGGLFLFACEYIDFPQKHPEPFFKQLQSDPDIVGRNCQIYDNIDLLEICSKLTTLKICQQNLSKLPDGRPLSSMVGPQEARYFTEASLCGTKVTWGAFLVVFKKSETISDKTTLSSAPSIPPSPTIPEKNTLLIPTLSVQDLHQRLGFETPLDYPQTSLTKPLDQWQMEIDDSPIFRYLYRHFRPTRHLEFGTWEGMGVTYCLEECEATVWTLNLPVGENFADGNPAYRLYSSTSPEVRNWANQMGLPATGFYRSDGIGFVGRFYLEKKLGHRVCQIYCNSIDWDIANYPPDFFDTVLIDGGHTKDIVINDTYKAFEVLRRGGLVMWHDFCPPVYQQFESTRGVMAAIMQEWDWLKSQTSQLFWIYPSWILLGIKK